MKDRTVHQLFKGEDVRYRVPIYQRHYVWNAMHWQHLWDDIAEKTNLILDAKGIDQPVPHFTGVIVTRENENGEVEVVDGQQRLTTFQIILCAIRDVCKDKFSGDLDSKRILKAVNDLIQNPTHPMHEANPDYIYKLLPTEGPDRDAFRTLVSGRPQDKDKKIASFILQAYNDFKDKKIVPFIRDEYKNIVALSQTLLFYFKIVEKPLDRNDQAARIFESLNGRGLPLTQFDLLRNNVFLRARNNRNNLYTAHWCHFNTEPYWFSNEIVDDFLETFLQAKLNRKFDPGNSLFDSYQRIYLGNLRNELSILMDHDDHPDLVNREFEELQRYSISYAEISKCSEESPIWFYKFLKEDLKIKSWHPLILLLKTELKLSEGNEKEIFRILESYIVRNMLYYPEIPEWKRETHFRKLRLDIVKYIRSGNESFGSIVRGILDILKREKNEDPWPDNTQIAKEGLKYAGYHWSGALIRYILFKIEQKNTDPNLTEMQLHWSRKLTLEHVMPRRWENATEGEPSSLSWPVKVEESEYEEQARQRDRCVESIGNLTLTTRDLNEAMKNFSFSTKKEEYYEPHSRLSLTNDIIGSSGWDVAQIKAREEKLVKEFCEIWPFAD